MRRDDVASSLIRRHFGTKCPLGQPLLNGGTFHIFKDIEPPYNPYYQYHGEATVIRDLPSFDNLGYEMQPVKLPATKEVFETLIFLKMLGVVGWCDGAG